MYCARCGAKLPEGAAVCLSCGFSTKASAPGGTTPSPSDPFDEVIRETKRAAKELAKATAKLSRQVATHADAVAKDPSGSTRKALDHLKRDVRTLVDDVSDALKKL